jgi:hypothetical protein
LGIGQIVIACRIGQPVAAPGHHAAAVVEQLFDDEAVAGGGGVKGTDVEIDAPAQQVALDRAEEAFRNLENRIGIAFAKFGQRLGQQAHAGGGGHGDGDLARGMTAQLGDLILGAADFGLHGLGPADEGPADLGQAHALGVAFEQRGAQLMLDLPDRAGDRGLGDAQMTAGSAQAAGFRDGKHVAQLAQFHMATPEGSSCAMPLSYQ